MSYKLTIQPDLDFDAHLTRTFLTEGEMLAAREVCADMLLFLQDDLGLMDDASNMFICEQLIDGEWEELAS